MSAAPANTLDNAYNAAQRANAILALIFDGLIDSIPNENVQTALYAVQHEVNEVLGIVEALNWREDQAPESKPAAGVKAEPAGDCVHSSGADLFDKLLQFAKSIAEEAAGIDAELKRYREGLAAREG
ncbi:hypothetical protein [Methylomonas koyamae]|uniref:hypothetical protein n=1 Tax=Methylomonas koyamae TaxID=702114 RepID=UPI002873C0D0|nr:hypothetical protein [Methylomonas koyamae]WNB74573.1 hypothetical protein RI210_14925 [Methylomonas koyamae]